MLLYLSIQKVLLSIQSGYTKFEKLSSIFSFANFHLVIYINKIELNKLSSLAQLIEKLTNQRQQILIFYCEVVEDLIVDT